jgi:hypothetical protein
MILKKALMRFLCQGFFYAASLFSGSGHKRGGEWQIIVRMPDR